MLLLVDGPCTAVQFMQHKMAGKPYSSQTTMTPSQRPFGKLSTAFAVLLFAAASRQTFAQATPSSAAASDSVAVAAVVHAYDEALRKGDSTAALNLLTDDAVILETGGVETKAEYRSHHLPGDMRYAQAVSSQSSPVRVTVRGDVAWAWSTSTSTGEINGRQINSVGAELMVLVRTVAGWKISAIHWSSRARRP